MSSPSIADLRANAAHASKQAIANAAQVDAGWAFLETLPALPLVPRWVHASTLYGARWHFVFELETPADVTSWRETCATLMRSFPPAPRWRHKDGCLSYPPCLTEKQENNERADSSEIAPFIVRLERIEGYATRANVEWYTDTPEGRALISVDLSAGASEVGLDLEAQYASTARRPDPQKPTSYTARFPFRTYRTDRFWAHSEADPHPTVAYWCASMCWRDADAAEKFLELTAPSEVQS